MLEETTVVHNQRVGESATHMVHALMKFALAVRYRKNVVLTSMAVAALLGAFYFATATRYYAATAEVLVRQTDPGNFSGSITSEGARQQSLMPTFEGLFTRTRIVEGALKRLSPEDLVDVAGTPRETWPKTLRKNLSAQILHGTQYIEVTYRSQDPEAAVNVVNAVVQSYQDFLRETHKGTAGQLIDVLTKEKVDLTGELAEKERELQDASFQVGDYGIRGGSATVHPIVKRAIYFSDAMSEARRQRLELEVSLDAIRSAVHNGEDLKQHVMTVADAVGREMLLSSLGFSEQDTYMQARMEQTLLEDRAQLASMRKDLGPAHPRVEETTNKIRQAEQYLVGYQQRVNQRLAEMQNTQLGPMLLQMVNQKLSETWQRERSFEQQYRQAENQAVALHAQTARLGNLEHQVQRLRDMHDAMVDKIKDTGVKQGGEEVHTAVMHDPVVAKDPISPSLARVIMMAFFGGLAVGLTLVYVLDVLDDRFRSAEEMQARLDVTVLAMVRQLDVNDAEGIEGLPMHVAPNSAECEAFRTLRTAMELADGDARQIVISSAEPGDGKTTVLANLAVAYAQSQKKTLLIDADLRRPRLTGLMGLRGTEGLSGIIHGQDNVAEMARACVRNSAIPGLDVLPSGPRPSNPAELLANVRFSELLAWAESVYDQILIDSPPALATSDAAVIGRLVDGIVMVVQPEKNRRRMVIRAVESFAGLKIPLLGVVVNRIGSHRDRGYYGHGYDYTTDYGSEDALINDPTADVLEIR
ncbi:MAG: polysaccharide biosynthesis tyrosine autokinase [Candidatus Nealsonbacteria bacterium]|nr:polysaccharide biosynthesis tyrosine autokinase [Candidatus Nealsonbacteria bacterium]